MNSTMRFLSHTILMLAAVLFSMNVSAACCNKNSDPTDWGHQITKKASRVHGFGGKLASKKHLFTATMFPGSLKNNISRIVTASGWGRVVWKLPFDYRWVSKTNLSAPDVKQLIAIVLNGYPVQATFYDTNRVLVVAPRALNE